MFCLPRLTLCPSVCRTLSQTLSRCFVCAALFIVLGQSLSVHAEPRELDWLELMPAEDLALLENMPEVEHEGDGPALLPDEIMTGRVVPEMSNVDARIPGFVVPLKTTQDMEILEFFLVPYYGACIHVPPPPPNQIIHVKYHEASNWKPCTTRSGLKERWLSSAPRMIWVLHPTRSLLSPWSYMSSKLRVQG